MFDKMKTLLDMQRKAQQMKQELEGIIFETASSDGIVKITMNGSQQIKDLSLNCNMQEIEKVDLENALKDAYNRAIKRSHDIAAQKMKNITGLNLGGLF